jgi:hypothetical protein
MQNKTASIPPVKDSILPTEKLYDMNIEEIKKQAHLQSHIEASENNDYAIYKYTTHDVEIALPIIAEGLKEKGFIKLEQSAFDEKIKTIFGDIFHGNNHSVKLRPKFNTVLANPKTANDDEFDYTVDNIFISAEYKFITDVPLIGDLIEFTDSNHYKIAINSSLIARNKYLFNNSQSDLAYLLAEDTLFLKTLVKSFGYTKEEKINTLAMNDYLDLDNNHMPIVGEIIFVKNAAGILEIKQELLQWISDHTRVNDNALLQALAQYAYSLYDNSSNSIFTNNPFETFSLDEKRKIAAYIANTYEPLHHRLTPQNPGIWPVSTVLENVLNEDKGLADFLRQHRYFSLPALKQELEPAN